MGKAIAFAARLICLVLLLAPIAATHAGTVRALYQARVLVTGQGEQGREQGFAKALENVLVKVSGDPRLSDDSAAMALAADAGEMVAAFRYRDRMAGIPVHDEQGTRDRPFDLIVDFHPEKIDAALRSLGREPWLERRPRVVVLLNVRNGETVYPLTADEDRGRDMREALAAAAWQFGIPVALPSATLLAKAGSNFAALSDASSPRLDETVQAAGGDVALVGSLVWDEQALGWVAEWRLASGTDAYRWDISGVSFDAAFRSGMAGAAQVLSGEGAPD